MTLKYTTLYTGTVASTGKEQFYKVPEQHGHVFSSHSVSEKDIIAPDRPANGKLGKNRPIGEKRDQSSKLPFKSGILPTRVSSGAAYRIPVYRKKGQISRNFVRKQS